MRLKTGRMTDLIILARITIYVSQLTTAIHTMPMKVVVVGTRWSDPHILTRVLKGIGESLPRTGTGGDETPGYSTHTFSYRSTAGMDICERNIDIVLWLIDTDQKYIDVAEAAVIDADALVVCVGGGSRARSNKLIRRQQLKVVARFHDLPASENVPIIALVSTAAESGNWKKGDSFARALSTAWPSAWKIVQLTTPSPPQVRTRGEMARSFSGESSVQIERFLISLFDEVAVTCGVGDELIPARPIGLADEATVLHSNVRRAISHWNRSDIPPGGRPDIRCCCLQS